MDRLLDGHRSCGLALLHGYIELLDGPQRHKLLRGLSLQRKGRDDNIRVDWGLKVLRDGLQKAEVLLRFCRIARHILRQNI